MVVRMNRKTNKSIAFLGGALVNNKPRANTNRNRIVIVKKRY